MSGHIADVARIADANEAEAVCDWFAAVHPACPLLSGAWLHRFETAAALAMPATGTAFFNRVIGLGASKQASRPLVTELVAAYLALGTRFIVHWGPHAQPAEVPDWLGEQGLIATKQWLVLHRTGPPAPAAAPEPPLRVERVGTEHAQAFAEVLCFGYGMPLEWSDLYTGIVGRRRWHNYLVYDGDLPVATASWYENGSVAWLGNSATLPGYRRRGAHTALNRARQRDAAAAGCQLLTGETWREDPAQVNQSLRNHARDGWRLAYVRSNYGPPQGAEQTPVR